MSDLLPLLLVIGGILGVVVLRLPGKLWLDTTNARDINSFKATYPHKKGVYYLCKLLPYAWALIYALVVFPGIAKLFDSGAKVLFFEAYAFFGGFSFVEGFIETASRVSAIRTGTRGQQGLTVHQLVQGEFVRPFGLRRISLAAGVAVLSWLILSLLG